MDTVLKEADVPNKHIAISDSMNRLDCTVDDLQNLLIKILGEPQTDSDVRGEGSQSLSGFLNSSSDRLDRLNDTIRGITQRIDNELF